MMGEQPTQGLGTAECMEQGLATSGVGTQELIPRVGLEITKATGIIKSVAISMETSHDENGVGTANLLDKVLATCETEGMIESGELSGVDDKLGSNVMPDQSQKNGFGTANMDKGLATAPRHTTKPNQTVTGAPDTIRNGIGVAKLTKVWEQNHGL